MASANSPVTLYQCSECDNCSTTFDGATIHAYAAHRSEGKGDEDGTNFAELEELEDDNEEEQYYPNKKFKSDKHDMDFGLNFQSPLRQKNSRNGSIYIDVGSLKRADMWQSENTLQLINCVKNNIADLNNRMLKKKHIWEKIRNIIATKMPGITRRQCEQKWRNLLNSQRKYTMSSKVTKSRVKKPEFFDVIGPLVCDDISKMMDSSCDDPLTTPSLDFDSQKITLSADEHEPLKLSAIEISDGSPDHTSILLKILSTLEARENSRNSFQRQIIELERTKLQALRKFIDTKEQQNAQKLQLLQQYLLRSTDKIQHDE